MTPVDRPPTLRVRLSAVGVDGPTVLLVRSGSGVWQLPGGWLDIGEQILSGLRRVVGETAGLVVEVERLVGLYTEASPILTLVFRGRHLVGQIKPGPDVLECRWARLDAIPAMLPPTLRDQILAAIRQQEPRHTVYMHQGPERRLPVAR